MIVEIPHAALGKATLDGVIEEFVTREGTDYGETEYALEQKKAAVLEQLERGQAFVVFDPDSQSCNIVTSTELASLATAGRSD